MNTAFLYDIEKRSREVMPKGTRVVLFGSQARGDAGPESDWDILILIDKPQISNEDYDAYAYPLVEMGWKAGEQVSPVLYTYNEWKHRRPTSFYQNVESEGIELCQ
jgi:predicted nucleotidyltransferase